MTKDLQFWIVECYPNGVWTKHGPKKSTMGLNALFADLSRTADLSPVDMSDVFVVKVECWPGEDPIEIAKNIPKPELPR